MPNTPLKIQNIITALSSNPDIPEELISAISSLYTDLQSVKTGLYGVGRDGKGDFAIDNPSFRNKIGDQRALTLTKEGILNLGSYYGVRPDVMVRTLGSMYAVPQWGRWLQSATLAGDGAFAFDTELFNNTYDLYRRQAGNTQIRIIQPGDYHVNVMVALTGLSSFIAGGLFTVVLLLNAAVIKIYRMDFSAASNISFKSFPISAYIQTTVNTDFVQVSAISSPVNTTNRFGNASAYSTIEICKVN